MADRVSASITIGGKVTQAQFSELTAMIGYYDLRIEWDGLMFTPDQIVQGEPLTLFANAIAWGVFEDLEQYCCDQPIPYTRWSGGCAGSFGPVRNVFDGKSGPLSYATDEDDEVVLHISTLEQLGSMRRIRSYLKPVDYVPPPLMIIGRKTVILTK